MSLTINPQTKLGALLAAYPGIDEKLIEWMPAYGKLKNPVVRKTVERFGTLAEAAKMGGVSIPELILKVREETGQGPVAAVAGEAPVARLKSGTPPGWLNRERIRQTIDADEMLARGIHPLGTVKQSVVELEAGEIVELRSGFRPEPLLEAMRASGLAVFSEQRSPGSHYSYFCRVEGHSGGPV